MRAERLRSLASRLGGVGRELLGAKSFKARSRPRYCADVLLYRVLRVVRPPGINRERTLVLRDGTKLTYRLNRGDIQTVREVWLNETYRPPFEVDRLDVAVDLGANIGFTALYLARRLGVKTLVAVEPDPENARLLRWNLGQNGVAANVLEAAVGPNDGSAYFKRAEDANLGKLSDSGISVRVASMESILGLLGGAPIDMLKIDIEGGEGPLLSGEIGWLDRTRALMIEFHPETIDSTPLVSAICARGFTFIPCGTVNTGSADTFVRRTSTDPARS